MFPWADEAMKLLRRIATALEKIAARLEELEAEASRKD